MTWIITKYLITASIVVAVSEIAKSSDRLGALIAALPLVTVLTLVWMYIEGQGSEKLSNHAFYTFWYVLPTLPMFLLFPIFNARFAFPIALLIGIVVTLICFALTAVIAKWFGVSLL